MARRVEGRAYRWAARSTAFAVLAAGHRPGSSELKVPKVGAAMPATRPSWFKVAAPGGERYREMRESLASLELHTVCDEAACPNVGECWNGGTATIMLLGDTCTRGCQFCNVKTSQSPAAPDEDEPLNAALAISQWGVDYVVLTSVDRDDLPDGGASHFARTVAALKELSPEMVVECLVSDFAGDLEAVALLATSGLQVYAHNLETVRRLTPRVRDPRAGYDQSLRTLAAAKRVNDALLTKSSLMLGLGETHDEIRRAMADLRSADVDVLTLGQYLRPTPHHLSVVDFLSPRDFDHLADIARREFGFAYVAAGPMVRSSYKAGEFYLAHLVQQKHQQQKQHHLAR